MKKVIVLLLIALTVILAVLFIGKNFIAKTAVTSGVKAITGLEMDIGSMDVGILNTLIGINNMKLYNPPDYPDRVMIDMPDIYIDYNLGAFLKRKVHLKEVRIDLRELTVIKNKNGELNIASLKVAGQQEKPVEKKKTEIKIDILDLKIGKVAYKDFSKGKNAKVIEYNVNLHERFHDITNLDEMGKIILVKALLNTNIAQLANFALDSLKSDISEIIGKAPVMGKPVQEIGEKAAETLKETTEGLKKKLKLPFGK